MIPLFTPEELAKAKGNDKLPCKCTICDKTFYKLKRVILSVDPRHTGNYCSSICFGKSVTLKQKVTCLNCDKEFLKYRANIRASPNHFCSRKCATTYNNKYKTHGTRRSKLEKYLEEQLKKLYSYLEIHFNRKDAINSELDIYIPSLNLAFELNGIFHYEPIFGKDKLEQIENNDNRKFQACLEKNIELCIINSSKQIRFTEKTSSKYLNIIQEIIDSKSIN